ncbi:unnamed protein product [Schistosoma turkestanicum]|nr:unnamed protein product [Schistosoma turkestanicum]
MRISSTESRKKLQNILIHSLITEDSSTSLIRLHIFVSDSSDTVETDNISDDHQLLHDLSEDFRLPHTLFPYFYDLRIQVHLHDNQSEEFFFNGSVSIKLKCQVSTTELFVHAYNNLKVSLDQIHMFSLDDQDQNNSTVEIEDITYHKDAECYRIQLLTPLQPYTHYILTFEQFRSDIKFGSAGLFLSRYVENGTNKYLASSQFEATLARRVFPCWDEPEFKAQFKVNIIRHDTFHSLSNMNLERTEVLHDDWRMDVYNISVIMPTYLLAFVVSQFSNIQKTDNQGRNFTVWARPEKIQSAEYALDIGIKLLEYFEDYFGIPYSLPKMDMIAVPNTSEVAMENWGLITFSEPSMLWSPIDDSLESQIFVSSVVSHELVHQLDKLVFDVHRALGIDASSKSRPLIYHAVSELNELDAVIIYDKGASLIQMMEMFMGPRVLKDGLKKYLLENQYKNTDEKDLWKALSKEWKSENNHPDIDFIMDSWTKKTNYPLVVVQRNQSDVFHFEQSRYLQLHDVDASPAYEEYTWIIPITYGSAKTVNWTDVEVLWMVNSTMIQTMNIDSDDWYLVNVKQAGFYRVHYADNNWLRLIDQLQENSSAIPEYSRWQIMNDLFSLANRGTVPYIYFLNATKYLKHEDQFIVWKTASRALLYINSMLVLNENYGVFQAYLRTLLDSHIQSVSWSSVNESQNLENMLLDTTLARLACKAEPQVFVDKTGELFRLWMSKPEENP